MRSDFIGQSFAFCMFIQENRQAMFMHEAYRVDNKLESVSCLLNEFLEMDGPCFWLVHLLKFCFDYQKFLRDMRSELVIESFFPQPSTGFQAKLYLGN